MNIFVLHDNPTKAAQMMCDKHVVKMIIESAQMLCTVANERGHKAPYRTTHKKHPCTLWVGESKQNWCWLIQHLDTLCNEYTRRYGRVHKTQKVLEWIKKTSVNLPSDKLTPFALAMPDKYKTKSAVESYRNYYLGEKAKFAKWKMGNTPNWWTNGSR